MPRRHCKMYGNTMHADDTHTECVSRLGKWPQVTLRSAGLNTLRVFQSCLSALAVSFLFREWLHPSCPPIFFLPGICEKKNSVQRIWAAGDKRAHVGSMPACLRGCRHRGCSRSAQRYPFPKRQGPQPKIALDPAPLISQAERGGARVSLPPDHPASSL